MSLRDFWINVRTGAGLIAPQVTVDTPKLDSSSIEGTLQRATLWLTPRAVAGFNEADFKFLPDHEHEKLTQLVESFRRIASTISPTASAPDETVAKALPHFRDIVLMLEFDRYGDAEGYQLGKQIEQSIEPYRPKELAELRFNTGLDHSGEPAIWIWVFLTDAASVSDEQFLENVQRLRDILDPVARTVAPDRWPYLSFRSLAEQAETVEAS
jgi:hypothetical protein